MYSARPKVIAAGVLMVHTTMNCVEDPAYFSLGKNPPTVSTVRTNGGSEVVVECVGPQMIGSGVVFGAKTTNPPPGHPDRWLGTAQCGLTGCFPRLETVGTRLK